MERRSSPVRRVALLCTALVLLVGLTGCNGRAPAGRGPVATVEGHEISMDRVQELMDAQVAYINALAKVKTTSVTPERLAEVLTQYKGENEHTLGTAGAAQVLSVLVDVHLFQNLLEKEGEKVTAADRTSAKTALDQQIQQSGVKVTSAMQPLIDTEVERAALLTALRRAKVDPKAREDQLRKIFEANKENFAKACVQQIATSGEAEAKAAANRIKAGEDFVDVANDVSLDKAIAQPGNPQSCVSRGTLAGVFGDDAMTAKTGDLLGPADAQGAWLIVQIWDEQDASFEDARAQLESQVPDQGETAVKELIAKAYATADVDIDRRFGTWNGVTGEVVPPVDPLAAIHQS
ncbi:MAG: peptidylprolyl isomerase [Acidimicrobiales bacterium]|nr:peptidylprolyl isomerase [Acidimicrobiales bacterium]